MKRFKMLCAGALALITSLFFTGCSTTSLQRDGNYWFSDPSASFKTPFEEICTYNVEVTKTTFDSSAVVENAYGIKMEITSGTYVTTLKTHEDSNKQYYSYKTELNVTGNYRFPGETETVAPFADSYVSYTEFTHDLKPIKSWRSVSNNTLCIQDVFDLIQFKYDYEIQYGESDATVSYTQYNATTGEPTTEVYTITYFTISHIR